MTFWKVETLLLEVESDVKGHEAELDVLNRYYSETRYPADFPEGFSWADAREAFAAAARIKEFVIAKISQ